MLPFLYKAGSLLVLAKKNMFYETCVDIKRDMCMK